MTLYEGTLYNRLQADAADDWAAYVEHPFVAAMADGSLPEAAFRHYLVQDYKFLIHFSRAYALAAYKADTLEEIRAASETLAALIGIEMEMHVKYCAGWGLDPAAMEAAPEGNACMAYTRYVLETGLRGDALDLHVALIPCVAGYGEIGVRLAADPATRREGNPYAAWVEMYSGEEYQAVARAAAAQLDRLSESRGGDARYPRLRTIFAEACRLEADFWQMGLDAAGT